MTEHLLPAPGPGELTEVDQLAQVDGRAIDRLEHLVRGSVLVLASTPPHRPDQPGLTSRA
jgi:hypothetical protein